MQSLHKTARRCALTFTLLLLALTSLPGLAQQDHNPLGNTYAVEVAPGVSVDALAAQMGMQNLGAIGALPGYYLFRSTGSSALSAGAMLSSAAGVISVQPQIGQQRSSRVVADSITDPRFRAQWHLNNTGQYGGAAGNDARVINAWTHGVTGAGVVVASVDDGVFWDHPDLLPNYRPDASYDFVDYDPNPMPTGTYSHGTSVAGVMAAAADGTVCGVGVAFNAGLTGLRLPLDKRQTDAQEAMALNYALNVHDVYNSSWGPVDSGTGQDMQAPGPLTRAALERGVRHGRGGRGAIYVWAAGNGRRNFDNVNADGYASSIYTIAVGATDNRGIVAWYSEPGASILVNAPSSGPAGAGIRTTASGPYSPGQPCNENFGGTSASSPLVAGVVALMLEANPGLTWRDVQHILVNSAERNDPANPDWSLNAAGHWVNHDYGFGRVNAAAAVALAKSWSTVDPHYTYRAPLTVVNRPVPSGQNLVTTFDMPEDFTVEHVEVVLNATHPARGQLDITFVSPSGTVSKLMNNRVRDTAPDYRNWRLMTVRNWGERSQGRWRLIVTDRTGDALNGTLDSWQLVIHGSKPSVSGELLRNTGFEKDRAGDGLPSAWTLAGQRAKADRLRMDTTPDRRLVFSGDKSLQLRGTRNKNLRLTQKARSFGLTTGDTLTLRIMAQGVNLSTGLDVRVRVRYAAPNHPDDLLILPIPSGTYDYTLLHDTLTLRGDVRNINVIIRFRTPEGQGRALLDDISLVAVKAGTDMQSIPSAASDGWLPLPPAPPADPAGTTLRGQ